MGGVLFLTLLYLWDVVILIIHRDVRILFVFEKVPHIKIEETSLDYLECWLLWDMDGKFIPILTVISH